MKKGAKRNMRVFLYILAFSMLLGIWVGRDWLVYGWKQLHGQWTLVRGGRSLTYLLHTEPYATKWCEKLALIQSIKQYAVDSLGLDTTDTYASVYIPPKDQQTPTMWVVTAAEPYALRAHKWRFPLIGSFPYKGFFDKKAAQKEQQQLTANGYDTKLSRASGWSTLGWIENPVFPRMLERSPARLTELILHELTHNLIYVKDSADFNESLASFIGTEGAKAFLRHYYGDSSSIRLEYLRYVSDHKRFYSHFIQGARQLDSLYVGFSSVSVMQKKIRKRTAIARICTSVDTICFESQHWKNYQKRGTSFRNNTFFMSYLRYRGQEDRLREELLARRMSLREYLRYLKKAYAHHSL